MTWFIEEHRGPAGDHVRRPEPPERTVRFLDVNGPALLLGSTQPEAHVDAVAARRAGVEVARRRSGGGAVLVAPGATLWCDIAIPSADPLWSPDVGRAFHWLGEVWVAALDRLGLEAAWHDGPMVNTTWSRHVCFAGLGPGEVTVEGRKVIGLSQRRTRGVALFQCCALLRWEPEGLVGLLDLASGERALAAAAVADAAAGIGAGRGSELRNALVAVLPAG